MEVDGRRRTTTDVGTQRQSRIMAAVITDQLIRCAFETTTEQQLDVNGEGAPVKLVLVSKIQQCFYQIVTIESHLTLMFVARFRMLFDRTTTRNLRGLSS